MALTRPAATPALLRGTPPVAALMIETKPRPAPTATMARPGRMSAR
jgi:hypothetical protein